MPRPVFAEQRTPPEATQHALDEIANAIAQGKITATPTSTQTPHPTSTQVPEATATPVPPATPEATATPVPGLPVIDQDNQLQGYLRPSSRGDPWIELALPQGRWDIVPQSCGLSAWTTITFWDSLEDDTAFVDECPLQTWIWSSDTPCAQDDDGTCDINLDQSYWDYLGHLPTEVRTVTPVPLPTRTPQPIAQNQSVPQRAAAAAPQPVTQAMATVVVTATPSYTSEPSRTPTPSVTATVTVTPTRSVTPIPTATVTPTPEPTDAAISSTNPDVTSPTPVYTFLHSWQGVVSIIGCIILGVIAVIVIKWLSGEH